MVCSFILPLCKKYGLVHLSQLLSEVFTGQCSVQGESFSQFSDVLHVKILRVLLQVIFPEVNAEFGSLVRLVVAVDSSHGVSAGHLYTGNLSVDIFKALEECGIIYFTLSHVI